MPVLFFFGTGVGRPMVKQAGKFVSYLRVSTDKQGLRGLGIAAQRLAVLEYLDGGKWQLVAEFVEQESGKRSDRPERRSPPAKSWGPRW